MEIPPIVMVLPLGALLKKSVADYRLLLRPILVGAVTFGLLLGFVGYQAQRGVEKQMGTLIGGSENTDIEPAVVQELLVRAQQGDEQAIQELGEIMGEMENVAPEAAAAFVGSVFTFVLIMWIISIVGMYYFLVVAAGRYMDPKEALRRTIGKIIPLIGLSIWLGIRSFIWIPFIGIIFVIVLMPRFALAPVFLLKDGRGIMESASLSYARSRGYWSKILGNTVVAIVCGMLVYLILGMILRVVGAASPLIMGLAGSVLSQLLFAYFSVFTVALAITVMENPLAPVGPAPSAPTPTPPTPESTHPQEGGSMG